MFSPNKFVVDVSVFGRWVSLASFAVFLGVFALSFGFECAATIVSKVSNFGKVGDLLDTLLSPIEIFSHLLRGFHAICDVGASTLESALCHCLQLEQFTILRVEFARSRLVSFVA